MKSIRSRSVLPRKWHRAAVTSAVVLLICLGLASVWGQQGSQKHIVSMTANDAPEGSRVSVVADLALNDYEAFRRGDVFHVKLPSAVLAAQSNLHGKGFENVQVQKSGDGVILSFKLQPGTTARVDQGYNRLDVVFSTIGAGSAVTQHVFPNQTPVFNTRSSAPESGRDSGLRATEKPNISAGSSEPAASTSQGASTTSSGTVPSQAQSSPQASNKSATEGTGNPAAKIKAGESLVLRWLKEDWVATFIPALVLLAVLLFIVLRVRSRQHEVKPVPLDTLKRTVRPELIVDDVYNTPTSSLWHSTAGEGFEQTETSAVQEQQNLELPPVQEEPNLEPAAQEEQKVETPIIEDFSEVTSVIQDDQTPNVPAPFDRADFEIKKILSGREYDRTVIDPSDAATRHVVSAALLAALAGRNVEQHASARRALMEHGYFDEITGEMRTAQSDAERAEAARKLGIIGDPLCTPHLIAALSDSSPIVRASAVEALGQIGDPVAISALNDLLARETSPQVPERLIEDSITAIEAAVGTTEEPAQIEKPALRIVEGGEKQHVRPEDEAFAEFLDRLKRRGESDLVDVVKAASDDISSMPPLTEATQLSEEELRLRREEEALLLALKDLEQKRTEAETARKQAEEDLRSKAETEARARAEIEARLRAEEEARRKAEEEEAARRKEEEEARVLAEQQARLQAEEEARLRAEDEARFSVEADTLRKAAEELARKRAAAANARKQAEEETRRRAEEEARRLAEEETRRLAEEEARRRAEEEARRRAEEEARDRVGDEARLRAEEERKVQEAENQRRIEEERLVAEQEALLKAAAEVARRRAEIEEARRKAEEEAQNLRAVEERIRQEEEERHRIEEERQRIEAEAHRRAEEERRRLEEVERQLAEEQRQFEELARRQTEEHSRRLAELEAARQKVEEETRQRAEQEKRIRSEIEALRKAEQEQRERIEAETRRRSEAEARLREEQARREHEEQARIKAEAEALRVAEEARQAEEARHRAEHEARTRAEEARVLAEEESRAKAEDDARVWAEAETRRRAEAEAKLEAEQQAQEQLMRDGAAEAQYQAKVSAGSASDVPLEVLNRLKSESSSDRIAALNEVLTFGGEEAFRLISDAFDDEAAEVQNAAARALYELQADRAASFTRALREGSPERRRRIGASLAASGLASEAIGNLTGESREKTYDAFSLLFLMAKAGEVQPLMQAIEDYPNIEARLAVVKLLALSGQSEIVPAFRRLAVRGSLPAEVRSAVMEAIYQISSQSRETTPSAA